MRLADSLLQELAMEAATTRRVLERVPEGQMTWPPAEKARTLGQLAMHVATTPGGVASLASSSPAQVPPFADEPAAATTGAILAALDESVAQAQALVGAMDDEALLATWRLQAGEREILAMPRIAFLRSIMLNHWYHHRGQLSVYLRLLGVPLPSIYGPSADENPFI